MERLYDGIIALKYVLEINIYIYLRWTSTYHNSNIWLTMNCKVFISICFQPSKIRLPRPPLVCSKGPHWINTEIYQISYSNISFKIFFIQWYSSCFVHLKSLKILGLKRTRMESKTKRGNPKKEKRIRGEKAREENRDKRGLKVNSIYLWMLLTSIFTDIKPLYIVIWFNTFGDINTV